MLCEGQPVLVGLGGAFHSAGGQTACNSEWVRSEERRSASLLSDGCASLSRAETTSG